MTVAGEHVAAERATKEGTSAAGEDDCTSAYRPGIPALASQTGGASDRSFVVHKHLKSRRVVENRYTGLLHSTAHQPHIFGTLHPDPMLCPIGIRRKR